MRISEFLSGLKSDSFEKNPEMMANRYALRCMNIIMAMIVVIWLLNVMDIFIINKGVSNMALLMSLVVYGMGMFVCIINGLSKGWIKYFVLFWAVLSVAVMHTFLTYHTVIILMMPIVFASMYHSKELILYTYALTVIGIIVSVYAGYYAGVCDANMVLLTAEPLSAYIAEDNTFLLTQVNTRVIYTLGLFFILPRVIISGVFAFICNNVSKIIGQNIKYAQEMELLAELDGMTGVYNKTKYLEVLDTEYEEEERVAVIFWDINNLKKMNDTKGHEKGDVLIKAVAESIQMLCTANSKAFRIGGDEFVLIIKGGREKTIQRKLNDWKHALERISERVNMELSVSYGYAWGSGKELTEIIHTADLMMYENKRAYHEETDVK